MFGELQKNLSKHSNTKLIQASAENTGIPQGACDAVVVGTAFHWFDKESFRTECRRILKGNKYVAILRICNNTPADKEIDKTRHYTEQDLQSANEFFGDGFIEHICFEYFQTFNEERYINNLLSSATAPLPYDANFDDYVQKCKETFNKHFGSGPAKLPYIVNCFIGRLDK